MNIYFQAVLIKHCKFRRERPSRFNATDPFYQNELFKINTERDYIDVEDIVRYDMKCTDFAWKAIIFLQSQFNNHAEQMSVKDAVSDGGNDIESPPWSRGERPHQSATHFKAPKIQDLKKSNFHSKKFVAFTNIKAYNFQLLGAFCRADLRLFGPRVLKNFWYENNSTNWF